MTTERTMSLYDDQLSNEIVDAIKKLRQEWEKPLPNYFFRLEFPLLRHSKESLLPCRETTEEFESVVSEFSRHVHSLFHALVICQHRDAEAVEEHTPYFSNNGIILSVEVLQQYVAHETECHHRAFHSSRLVLKTPDALPQISWVKYLRVLSEPCNGLIPFARVRPVSLRVPLELMVQLPAIQALECPWAWEHLPVAYPTEPMRHYSRPWEGPWRDSRHDFGRAVLELNERIPPSLTRARFWCFQIGWGEENQSVPMPNLVHPADVDPFSVGLRLLASHLEYLDLRAILTPDFFDVQEVSWPRMKRLYVEFHPMRSDGSWYFTGPQGDDPHPTGFQVQGEGWYVIDTLDKDPSNDGLDIQDQEHYPPVLTTEEDEKMDYKHNDYEEEWYDEDERWPDMFRMEPSPDKIEPLLTTFAQRLKTTPSMEEAELFTYLGWFPSDERRSAYEKEGWTQPCEWGWCRWGMKYTAAKGESKALVEWQVGDWRPPSNVAELFDALGGEDGIDMTWKALEFTDDRPSDCAPAFI